MPERPAPPLYDFHIGWICALQIEVDAARAVLDEEYEDIREAATYILGRISRHNVVVACPPAGVIGIGAAAVTLERLRAAFPAIKYAFMVGIAGGVPGTAADVRLGDVVVSQPEGTFGGVVQYDLGKIEVGGRRLRKGFLNAPPQELLSAITKQRSNFNLGRGGFTQSLIDLATDGLFKRPDSGTDVLYEASYKHTRGNDCSYCAASRIITRPQRRNEHVVVHYGLIASGNQVVKDGLTRDILSNDLGGVLCFEMEAAGLMNTFSCLVVRGICDYADSHKNKQWQPFAAITAALCSKEILTCVPSVSLTSDAGTSSLRQSLDLPQRTLSRNLSSLAMQSESVFILKHPDLPGEIREQCFQALRFDQLEARYRSIKAAHSKTCSWLLRKFEFVTWLDDNSFLEHRGFLWIKAKAATGKSTVMKFLFAHVKQQRLANIVAAFFFNARGNTFEKSTLGLYQSLLYQLLDQCSDVKAIFDSRVAVPDEHGSISWTIEKLRTLYKIAIEHLGERSIICFVDALDECDDEEVQEMVDFFDELGSQAEEMDVRFRVLFSTRHYPHVAFDKGFTLILDTEEGHQDDITQYVNTELKAGLSDRIRRIRRDIVERSAGIFLWVILVVDILNKEFRRGRIHAMEKRLQEIPNDIQQLFSEILNRGGTCPDETILCLQWVLYAKRPLKLEELYFAVLSGCDPESVGAWDPEEITRHDMERFILDISRGLVEETKSKSETVQFIHQPLREYFISGKGLRALPFSPAETFAARSHDQLKLCCATYYSKAHEDLFSYLKANPTHAASTDHEVRAEVHRRFPFLVYAHQNVLFHSNAAGGQGSAQTQYWQTFNRAEWLMLNRIVWQNSGPQYGLSTNPLYVLADQDLGHLMHVELESSRSFESLSVRHRLLVLTGLSMNDGYYNLHTVVNEQSVAPTIISYIPTNVQLSQEGVKMAMTLLREERVSISKESLDLSLSWAIKNELSAMVQILLACKATSIDAVDGLHYDAVDYAIAKDDIQTLGLLQKHTKPLIEMSQPEQQKWLLSAVRMGSAKVLSYVLERSSLQRSAVHRALETAASEGHSDLLRIFLSHRTTIDASSDKLVDNTVLEAMFYRAAAKGESNIMEVLFESGLIDINARFSSHGTPLLVATRGEHLGVIKWLLQQTTIQINIPDRRGCTALTEAARFGYSDVLVLMANHHDVDVNTVTKDGMTALLYAVVRSDILMCKALLKHSELQVNIVNRRGQSAFALALKEKNFRIVDMLLEREDLIVDIPASDVSSLQFAITYGPTAVAERLLQHPSISANAAFWTERDLRALAAGRSLRVSKLHRSYSCPDLQDEHGEEFPDS